MARVVRMLVAVMVCGASAAQAQTSAAPARYAQFDIAATLGHKSDSSVGGEVGFTFRPNLDVFFEGGHIGNAASSDMDQGATRIANNVGATANAIAKVNFFDVGVRYRFMPSPRFHPYAAIGIGAAHVTNQTTFSVNGTVVPESSLGIQSGVDLNGSETKAFLMLGVGTTIPFKTRYLFDVSYRFGGVLGAANALNGTSTLATNRIQLGIGLNF
jgi:opacity protein-like surface antigen